MLEMLTKLSLLFHSTQVAATTSLPAREWLGTLKASSEIKTVIGPYFCNPLEFSSHEILHEILERKGSLIIMKITFCRFDYK